MGRLTGIDSVLRKIVQAVDQPGHPGVCHRDRTASHRGNFIPSLLLDEIVEPKIEGPHRHARKRHADQNRKELFASQESHRDLVHGEVGSPP
jgi:hypothetical protein